MTEPRLRAFFDVMTEGRRLSGESLDYRSAFDLRFVNRAHALEMRR